MITQFYHTFSRYPITPFAHNKIGTTRLRTAMHKEFVNMTDLEMYEVPSRLWDKGMLQGEKYGPAPSRFRQFPNLFVGKGRLSDSLVGCLVIAVVLTLCTSTILLHPWIILATHRRTSPIIQPLYHHNHFIMPSSSSSNLIPE